MLTRRADIGVGFGVLLGVFVGCHSSSNGTGGARTTATVSVSVSDVATGAMCPFTPNACPPIVGCSSCIEANCCAALMAANGNALDATVVSCAENACLGQCYPQGFPANPSCAVPAVAPSNGACVTLGGAITCNPVTNAPCGVGSACDSSNMGFACYPTGNTRALCQTCGQANAYCQPGLTCAQNECERYCCSDADCGSGHTCAKGEFTAAFDLGVCSSTAPGACENASSSSVTTSTSSAGTSSAASSATGSSGAAGGANTTSSGG